MHPEHIIKFIIICKLFLPYLEKIVEIPSRNMLNMMLKRLLSLI